MNETNNAPRDFNALRADLIERRTALPKRLTQVAAFAIDNPDEIAFGTVASIASLAGVQPSTLVRFAQALGYAGFSDMQKVFRSRLREGVTDYRERLEALRARDETCGAAGLIAGFSEAASFSLTRLRQQLDGSAIEEMVQVLENAETIYIVGQRRSFPVASYLAYALAKIGVRNVLVDNLASMSADVLRFAGERDAAVCISFTPYSGATLDLAAQLALQGVPTVSITDSAFSPLTQSSTAWVEIVEADFGGFRSVAGTFVFAIALAVALGERRGRAGRGPEADSEGAADLA
jgi:DNA-binding MurR/RpiR family transcriptional regulator